MLWKVSGLWSLGIPTELWALRLVAFKKRRSKEANKPIFIVVFPSQLRLSVLFETPESDRHTAPTRSGDTFPSLAWPGRVGCALHCIARIRGTCSVMTFDLQQTWEPNRVWLDIDLLFVCLVTRQASPSSPASVSACIRVRLRFVRSQKPQLICINSLTSTWFIRALNCRSQPQSQLGRRVSRYSRQPQHRATTNTFSAPSKSSATLLSPGLLQLASTDFPLFSLYLPLLSLSLPALSSILETLCCLIL